MYELLAVLIPIAVIDSTSITPVALVPLISILAGKRPLSTAFFFLGGLFVSYLAMALAFLFGLSSVLAKVNAWLSHRWHHPEPADFSLQILVGLVMLVFGFRVMEKRAVKTGGREIKEGISPWGAFGFACMLNVIGFPGALPYFAAADRIVEAQVTTLQSFWAVVFYVTIFVMPLGCIILLRTILGAKGDAILQAVQRFFKTWGKGLLVVLLILLGLVLVVDGIAYFMGQPLIPIGYPLK